MSLKIPGRLSFFGLGPSDNGKKGGSADRLELSPSLKLQTDKEFYRPGDWVTATLEICNPKSSEGSPERDPSAADELASLLVDNLTFEIKGMEKLDAQWFVTPKPLPGSKQKRGEHLFLDSTTPSMISKIIVLPGCTRTYIVRAELPKILPPSYKGTTIRYIYYVRSTLHGRRLVLENGESSTDDFFQLEARAPLHIWITQKSNSLLSEGNLSGANIQTDIFWKEKDADSEWTKANEMSDGFEEGYESSRDEVSSVSSYNPNRGNLDNAFRSSLSLQSMITRVSNNEAQYSLGERSSFPSYVPISQLSVAEVIDDSDLVPPDKSLSSPAISSTLRRKYSNSPFSNDAGQPISSGPTEPTASEGFIRGRSYNIRIDDQVLLRFSPKNSDSTYYFGDLIGGTLTFFHGEGARQCLEVSVTLETSETISQRFVHPSRRSSPTITKVQSDHYEVVADLLQTNFLFSIPMDGPMSFSTPYISVQWALRFEFFTTPKHVDLNRYEHPLLIEEREKGEWVLPITVYAPPPRTQAALVKNEKSVSLGNLWIRT